MDIRIKKHLSRSSFNLISISVSYTHLDVYKRQIIYHLQSIYIKIYVICRQKLLVNKARYLLTILSFKYQDLFYL